MSMTASQKNMKRKGSSMKSAVYLGKESIEGLERYLCVIQYLPT